MKDISKRIAKLCQDSKLGLRPKDVVDDIMQVLFNAITGEHLFELVFPHSALRVDKSFYQQLERYKKDLKAWDELGNIATEYMQLVRDNTPFSDLIGGLYSEMNLNKKWGQFLTPWKVASGLQHFVQMDLSDGKPTTLADPGGCGAGTLLLAPLQHVFETEPHRLSQLHVIALDIDWHMVIMCSVQIVLPMVVHNLEVGSLSMYHGHGITDYNKPIPGMAFIPRRQNWIDLHTHLQMHDNLALAA